jgi:hypothetical protein
MSIAGFTNSKQAIRPAIGNQNAAEPGRQGLGKKNTTCVELNRFTLISRREGGDFFYSTVGKA